MIEKDDIGGFDLAVGCRCVASLLEAGEMACGTRRKTTVRVMSLEKAQVDRVSHGPRQAVVTIPEGHHTKVCTMCDTEIMLYTDTDSGW